MSRSRNRRRSLLLVALGIVVTSLSSPSRTFPFFTFGYEGRLLFAASYVTLILCGGVVDAPAAL